MKSMWTQLKAAVKEAWCRQSMLQKHHLINKQSNDINYSVLHIGKNNGL